MLDERQSGLLRDILDSALLIRACLAGIDGAAFLGDPEKQDAGLRGAESPV
ncbi:MAG: hypothetical protein ACREH8_07005 [Opitutaceae bacterium]